MRSTGEWLLLLPVSGIGILAWLTASLSLNKFQGCLKASFFVWYALFAYTVSFTIQWFVSMGTVNSTFAFQLTSSLIANSIAWYAFLLLYNESFSMVTRQQLVALGTSLATTLLWEVNSRMIVDLKAAQAPPPA